LGFIPPVALRSGCTSLGCPLASGGDSSCKFVSEVFPPYLLMVIFL